MNKTFNLVAKGVMFNLSTFVTEDSTIRDKREEIVFHSRKEFVEKMSAVLIVFMKDVSNFAEGTPKITIGYKGATADLKYITDSSSYCERVVIQENVDIIMNLVREHEESLSKLTARTIEKLQSDEKDELMLLAREMVRP